GFVDLFHAGRTNCFFSSSSASGSSFPDRLRPVVFPWHRIFLQHAHGTPASRLRPARPLPRGARLPHAAGLEWVPLVRNVFWISGQHLRHSPAPHLQRKTVLVSRDALRRNPLWPVREPQSLCRIRRIDSPSLPRSPRSR